MASEPLAYERRQLAFIRTTLVLTNFSPFPVAFSEKD